MELIIILILTIIGLVIGLAFSIIGILERIKGIRFDNNHFIYVYTSLFLYSFIVFLLLLSCMNKPKAMDVYSGKTTLEITYKNGVPTDSIVVWK